METKTIEERASFAALRILEEIGISKHSVDRVSEIIAEKMLEQKAIDDAEWLKIKASWEREAQINHNDEANYQQGFHDAIEMAFKWLKARNVLTDASLRGFRIAMRNRYEI